ncbi:MAG: hypothetical protein AVDCRST_MAG91-2865, partial [uncultured Sphingomonadaceae bacterium]
QPARDSSRGPRRRQQRQARGQSGHRSGRHGGDAQRHGIGRDGTRRHVRHRNPRRRRIRTGM